MRLIDADALKDRFDLRIDWLKRDVHDEYSMGLHHGAETDVELIDEMFTISPESLRPKGRWIGEGDGYADGELVYDVWYCSECNHCIDDGTDDPEMLPNYCPTCGAKMELNKEADSVSTDNKGEEL